MSTTLGDILNCSRPLFLEANIEGFDYGQTGSCFLLRVGDRLRVVTARHCLWQNTRPNPEQIRSTVENLWIPQRMMDKSPLSFGFTSARAASSTTHASACDFAVIEISCNPWPDTADFYDLAITSSPIPKCGDKLVVAGYPQLINEIQYPDEKQDGKLKPRRLLASGIFAGGGTAPMLNAMRLDEPEKLASYNGMSGSPVFLVRKQGPGALAELVGVAVSELRSAGIIEFIPTQLLVSALDR
ncbi:MAG: serine protease [Acidobacteriaceae bacterium]